MDTPHAKSEDGTAASGTVVAETRTVRRPAGRVYWISAVVTAVLLTIAIGVSRGPGLEQTLKNDVLQALDRAGFDEIAVSVDGRMVTANVPAGVDADDVKTVVGEVGGVSAVTAMLAYASYAEADGCADLQEKLDQVTRKQRIPFTGRSTTPTAEGSRMLRSVAKLLKACPPAVVYVGGHTDPATRLGSTISLHRAKNMKRALLARGIAATRLAPRGYGDQFPIDETGKHGARNERGSIIVRSK